MIQVLVYIITCYFLLGAVAIAVINHRNKTYASGERWVKYIFYLLVVCATVSAITYGYLPLLALAIVGMGCYEIITAWLRTAREWNLLQQAMWIYLVSGVGFCMHTFRQDMDTLLLVYTIVFVFDGFAQITGQLLGRKKIFPIISPEKTWAGVIGGYISVILTGLLLRGILDMPITELLLKTLVTASAALTGDLLASLYKRKCGIKDYSRLIPGHGGVLDRFDSYIMAGAVFWFVF